MTTKTETLADKVEAFYADRESVSCYEFAKLWSAVRGSAVREQMIYNYRAKKLIKVDDAGRITKETALSFLGKRSEQK